MEVQIVENWSEIAGTVRSLSASNVAGFMEVEISVDQVNPVSGFANLLQDAAGKNLMVLIPDELVKSLAIASGNIVVCRVRRANLNRIFVHREHISARRSN
jgi:hypothetical protein